MKYSFVILAVLLTIVGIGIVVLSKKSHIYIPPSLSQTVKADTTLSLSPNPLLLSSETGSVDVVIDTGSNSVSFVQIKLLFDPKYLSDMRVTQGPFLQEADILNTFVNQDLGTLTYILALPKNTKAIQGKGTIATITFKTTLKPDEKTALSFMKETLVTNDTFVGTVLKKTNGTKIIRE